MYQRNLFPLQQAGTETRVFHGTNFRHAVEFSRSGRTPSQPFQADPGQPEIRYPVGVARVKPGTDQLPTWSNQPRWSPTWRSRLGEIFPQGSDPVEEFFVAPRSPRRASLEALRAGPFWRPSNKENISQRRRRESNRGVHMRVVQCLRGFWPRDRVSAQVCAWGEFV
jgi:hypothetical protein